MLSINNWIKSKKTTEWCYQFWGWVMIITNGNGSVNGGSLQADSQPKSVGLMCRLTATWCSVLRYDTIRYDTSLTWTQKLNVISLIWHTKLRQTTAIANSVQYMLKIREGSPEGIRRLWRKGFVKEMSFKSGVKSRGSDRWSKVVTVISYHNINFWGASSKTPAPRPLNKQVSFQ